MKVRKKYLTEFEEYFDGESIRHCLLIEKKNIVFFKDDDLRMFFGFSIKEDFLYEQDPSCINVATKGECFNLIEDESLGQLLKVNQLVIQFFRRNKSRKNKLSIDYLVLITDE